MMASHTNGIHRTRSHRLRVLHSGCRQASWAMMTRQARRSSAIQHDTVRCGFLSRRSYVAPSRRSRGSAKRPRKELTYCPIYGFKPCVICAKDLTPALFCVDRSFGGRMAALSATASGEDGRRRRGDRTRVRAADPAGPGIDGRPRAPSSRCARTPDPANSAARLRAAVFLRFGQRHRDAAMIARPFDSPPEAPDECSAADRP